MIKKQLFKRVIPALIALAPFAVIKITELIWFSDQYLFEWMSRRNYLYIWVVAIISAAIYKWIGYVISFSCFVSFWMAFVIGAIRYAYRSNRHPYGMDKISLMEWRIDKSVYIWIISFLFLLLGCLSFYLIKRHIRKKKAAFQRTYDESMNNNLP